MKIFLSGIGGIGMSAYAALMKHAGHDVSGSDAHDSALIADLKSQGIAVSLKQDGNALAEGTELLVHSEAIPVSAPERVAAKERGIPQLSYFQALGKMIEGKEVIAICGTHGKSSTTAMIAKIFIECGRNPSVVLGTKMKELGNRNWRAGDPNLWIVEACEYRRSFLALQPTTIILTNADGDHFDAFKNAEEYQHAFIEFMSLLPENGMIIGHGEDKETKAIMHAAKKILIDADTEPLPTLATPGVHMKKNAQLAVVLAKKKGIDEAEALKALAGFSGTWRRMENLGETMRGVTVIDDYAHHPVEIRATIAAMKEHFPRRRLVCVFEPHTHDRVLKLWNDFTVAFSEADLLFVTKVFDARPEKDKEQVDAAKFAAEIGKTSKVSARPSGTITKTKATLEALLQPNDVLLIMGAGNSTKLAHAMVR
jgi:UDP-N-acetylmuramate--alanine ligase